MSNNITEVVFILDKSGSMQGFEGDTVGGFNATLDKQRALDGTVYVSTVLFNQQSEVLHDRLTIDKIKPMVKEEFSVGGCTALYDAVGDAVHHIRNVHKYIRPEDVPDHTVFVIMTDGLENASRRYSRADVKRLIGEMGEKGWEFIFLAANIDAAEAAEDIGIRRERSASFRQNAWGMKACYSAASDAICAVRCETSLDDADWDRELKEDAEEPVVHCGGIPFDKDAPADTLCGGMQPIRSAPPVKMPKRGLSLKKR